jgi:hypothetical protein
VSPKLWSPSEAPQPSRPEPREARASRTTASIQADFAAVYARRSSGHSPRQRSFSASYALATRAGRAGSPGTPGALDLRGAGRVAVEVHQPAPGDRVLQRAEAPPGDAALAPPVVAEAAHQVRGLVQGRRAGTSASRSTTGLARMPGTAVEPMWWTAARRSVPSAAARRPASRAARAAHPGEWGCSSTGPAGVGDMLGPGSSGRADRAAALRGRGSSGVTRSGSAARG